MSWRCVILLSQSAWVTDKQHSQVSPLRFPTAEEARVFGRAMFEPPETVKSWDVEPVEEPANYSYKKGQLKRL